MNPRFHKNVLAKVKNTINKVKEAQADKSSQNDYLVKMNISPLMGRRDAAYDRVETLLADKLFTYSDIDRKKIYETAVKLLDTVLEDSQEILIALDKKKRIEQEKSFICFLELLYSIIEAADNLVDYELSLYNKESTVNKFLGSVIEGQLRETDDIISDSEMTIVQSINGLFEVTRTQLNKLREYSRRGFTRHNAAKYKKSFAEYKKIFESLND
ncbi:MAG: hypothetical protein KAS17_10600 [Victivallaceae bacterium]|nr:hypothetical protein [Victivallaceae bacterium]